MRDTKTFNIACKYLKNINFKTGYIHSIDSFYDSLSIVNDDFESIKYKYSNDKNHKKISNNHYKDSVFSVAIAHLADLSYNQESCFDVACKTVKNNSEILKAKHKKWAKTVYPLVMVEEYNKYCDEIKNPPCYIQSDDWCRRIFMVAYHYIIDEK